MKKIWILFGVLAVLICPRQSFAQINHDLLCPVMAKEKINEKYHYDYQGERIYFCCTSCIKKFKRAGEVKRREYLARYKTQTRRENS